VSQSASRNEALGPIARRRVKVATALLLSLTVVLAWWAVARLHEKGIFEYRRWSVFLEPDVVKFLIVGLWGTVKAAALSAASSLSVGMLVALMRLSRIRTIALIGYWYVSLLRSVPTLLWIMFCFFALPSLGVNISSLWALVLGITLYNSTVFAEIFRAGVLSLARGQTEAALALGMSRRQLMRFVLLPQAIRVMMPSILTQLVVLLKDTSLGYVIGYEELLRRGQQLGEYAGNLVQTYTAIAAFFIVVGVAVTKLAQSLSRRALLAPAGSSKR
jgi:glutamate transport system permease protein